LLAKFDCAKDSSDARFTVVQNVDKKIHNQNTNKFFAPEVINSNMGIGVDWEKADIYSLAKTIAYIIFGKIIENTEPLIEIDGIDDELKLILMEMLDECPQNRPSLDKLSKVLKTIS